MFRVDFTTDKFVEIFVTQQYIVIKLCLCFVVRALTFRST